MNYDLLGFLVQTLTALAVCTCFIGLLFAVARCLMDNINRYADSLIKKEE